MSTNNVDAAAKIVNDLENDLESCNGRVQLLHKRHAALAYAARTGDKKARADIATLNVEIANNDSEIEVITAALVEARTRLQTAQQAEAQAAARANAETLRLKLSRFCELATDVDEALADAVSSSNEMNAILKEMAQLGCTSPNATQLRVLGTIAIKSFVMQIPWTAREWEHLPPHQRRTLGSFVAQWREQIDARLGNERQQEVA